MRILLITRVVQGDKIIMIKVKMKERMREVIIIMIDKHTEIIR